MLFPPPVGPTSPSTSPFRTEKETPRSASPLPSPPWEKARPRTSRSGGSPIPAPAHPRGRRPLPGGLRPVLGKLHGQPQELVDPPHGGAPPLEEVDHPSHRHRREGEHREVRVEGDEPPEGEGALDDGPSPEEQDEGDAHAGEQADRPVERRGGPRDGQVVPVIPLALPGEPLLLPRLEGERLHQADPGDVLLQRRVHRGERLLDQAVPPVEGAPVLPGEVHHRGGDQQRHAGEHGADPEHEGDREQPGDDASRRG